MLGTMGALAGAGIGQNETLPALTRTAPDNSSWEAFRRRNTFLDGCFYDVGKLSTREAELLGAIGILEGAILLVPPSGKGDVAVFATIDDFVAAGGASTTSLCLSGVGSSALGAAAFARNVADATGKPAAAVVSGYGMSDLMTEALGGWFWFGTVNRLRHVLEVMERHHLPTPKPDTGNSGTWPATAERFVSRDTQTCFALLCDERLNFSLLTGHSKGNLVLSEALNRFVDWCKAHDRQAGVDRLIVTFSATIGVPPEFHNIVDVMGGFDPLGCLNSIPGIPIEKLIPWRGHHTNTEIYGHLPVTRVLGDILAQHS